MRQVVRRVEGQKTLKIGITGHRKNRLNSQECQRARAIMEAVFRRIDSYTTQTVELLSGMADGTDLIAAAARPSHWHLHMILAQNTPDWVTYLEEICLEDAACFMAEIERPSTILTEIAQSAPDYDAVARYLAHHSDVLVALWDGGQWKPGGTGDVVAMAQQRQLPVLHIPYPMTRRCRII